jgi:hypothetical protein
MKRHYSGQQNTWLPSPGLPSPGLPGRLLLYLPTGSLSAEMHSVISVREGSITERI